MLSGGVPANLSMGLHSPRGLLLGYDQRDGGAGDKLTKKS
jgi:hypothetical protein